MMGALGNVLFLISFYTGQIAQGVAIDLSLIGVFIAGLYGGPAAGVISGAIAGVLPGIMFGPLGNGGVLGLIGLPLGKALTGLTIGLLAKGLNLQSKAHSSVITIPTVLVSYVPEGIFTYVYFTNLLPLFIQGGNALPTAVVIGILLKAIAEVTVMSIIMAALIGNRGFSDFVRAFFSTKRSLPTTKPAITTKD